MLRASCNHQNVLRDERWDLTGFEEDEMNGPLHRATSMVVVAALLVTTTACHDTTSLTIMAPQLPAQKTDRIVGVTTVDGEVVTFDDPAVLVDPKTKSRATPAALADPKNEVVVAGEVDDKKVRSPSPGSSVSTSTRKREHLEDRRPRRRDRRAHRDHRSVRRKQRPEERHSTSAEAFWRGAAAPSSTPGTGRGTSSTPSRTPGPSRAAWRGAATWSWTGSGRRTRRTGS